jgi:hypothetical protein
MAVSSSAFMPDAPSDWTDQAVNDAIDVLRVQSFDAFSRNFCAGVFGLSLHRDDFKVYCLSLGYPLRNFWFGRHTARLSTAKAERDCADWLRSLARKPKEHPKAWYREEASRSFPGLSLHGFDRAWNREAPTSWRKSGALHARLSASSRAMRHVRRRRPCPLAPPATSTCPTRQRLPSSGAATNTWRMTGSARLSVASCRSTMLPKNFVCPASTFGG